MSGEQPGRPKGTRVGTCKCRRRVAGEPRSRVKCPDCGKIVTIPWGKPNRGRREHLFLKSKA